MRYVTSHLSPVAPVLVQICSQNLALMCRWQLDCRLGSAVARAIVHWWSSQVDVSCCSSSDVAAAEWWLLSAACCWSVGRMWNINAGEDCWLAHVEACPTDWVSAIWSAARLRYTTPHVLLCLERSWPMTAVGIKVAVDWLGGLDSWTSACVLVTQGWRVITHATPRWWHDHWHHWPTDPNVTSTRVCSGGGGDDHNPQLDRVRTAPGASCRLTLASTIALMNSTSSLRAALHSAVEQSDCPRSSADLSKDVLVTVLTPKLAFIHIS